jgi:hypothetical protein
MKVKKYKFYIGIDCGVNTGVAVWNSEAQKFIGVGSMKIHEAMELIKDYVFSMEVFVRVEDARLRKWFGPRSDAKLQGAGSVKRDAKIWEDFLVFYNIPFEMVPPQFNATKLKAEVFAKITKWERKTNEHARDAAMLVFKK